jgi:hypothetical protein
MRAARSRYRWALLIFTRLGLLGGARLPVICRYEAAPRRIFRTNEGCEGVSTNGCKTAEQQRCNLTPDASEIETDRYVQLP